jgi:uncharacterized membrane protein YeaQ/YmgE (transglycosylase-associated protein family)
VSLYVLVVLAVPFVVAIASSARSRIAVVVTLAATLAVTVYAYERIVPDRDEIADALTFFLVYVHMITAPVAGVLASLLVPRSRGVAWPIVAALIGSVGAVALRYVFPLLFGDDHLTRALDVIGPVTFASTFAVLAATITARPPATA